MPKENEIRGAVKEASDVLSGRKSKLVAVREQILRKPEEVYYAGEIVERDGYLNTSGHTAEEVDMIVSPIKTKLKVEELNSFMNGLVKNIDISGRDEAVHDRDSIVFGKLYFRDPIGRVERTVIPIEKEALQECGIKIGRLEDDIINRRTVVTVYPNPSIARTIFNHEQHIRNGAIRSNPMLTTLRHHIEDGQIKYIEEGKSLVTVKILKHQFAAFR